MTTLLLPCMLLITALKAQTLWIYDSTTWREIGDAELNIGSTSSYDTPMTLDDCKSYCESAGIDCLSISWNGDTSSSTATGLCDLYNMRFGFKSGGFDVSVGDDFAAGKLTLRHPPGLLYTSYHCIRPPAPSCRTCTSRPLEPTRPGFHNGQMVCEWLSGQGTQAMKTVMLIYPDHATAWSCRPQDLSLKMTFSSTDQSYNLLV